MVCCMNLVGHMVIQCNGISHLAKKKKYLNGWLRAARGPYTIIQMKIQIMFSWKRNAPTTIILAQEVEYHDDLCKKLGTFRENCLFKTLWLFSWQIHTHTHTHTYLNFMLVFLYIYFGFYKFLWRTFSESSAVWYSGELPATSDISMVPFLYFHWQVHLLYVCE